MGRQQSGQFRQQIRRRLYGRPPLLFFPFLLRNDISSRNNLLWNQFDFELPDGHD